MPELAEVEFYRKQWNPGIGQKVKAVHVHPNARIYRDAKAQVFPKVLAGKTFKNSSTHGKQMLFHFAPSIWLGLHLGMTGKLTTAHPEIAPAKSEHLVIALEETSLVFSDYRMFGKVTLDQTATTPSWWKKLPPEILSKGFTLKRVETFLKRRAKSPIKAVLLMQEMFPGLGNWMVDEILWRAEIHPATRAGELSSEEIKSIRTLSRTLSRQALRVIGEDWGTPPNSWLFNHRWKEGGICPKTNEPLVRETIAGRTTCYSPSIQILK